MAEGRVPSFDIHRTPCQRFPPRFSQLISATHTLCTVAVVLRLRLSSPCNIVAPIRHELFAHRSRGAARWIVVHGTVRESAAPPRVPLLAAHSFRSPAAPGTIVPPNRPVRAQDALSTDTPPRPCRAESPPVRTATSAPRAVRHGVRLAQLLLASRLRGPRPSALEPCLIVRPVGGWPAGRTAFSAHHAQTLHAV